MTTHRPMEIALQFDEAMKRHGPTASVGPASFTVSFGETVALRGHNGSGKSTLLECAAGLTDLDAGAIRVRGCPAGELLARATVSFVPDHPVLYDDLSLREHVEYLTRLYGAEPDVSEVNRLVGMFELTDWMDDLPSRFSRGMRQKTALIIALTRPFSVLLLDEPFSGLDERGASALRRLLREVGRAKAAVLVATHDAPSDVFDRVVKLDGGRIVSDSPVEPGSEWDA